MGLNKNEKIKDVIVDEILTTFVFLGLPLIFTLLLVAFKFGWSYVVLGHIVSLLLLGFLFFIRRNISFRVKCYVLCLVFLFTAITGIYHYGLQSGWSLLFVAISLFITFFFSRLLGLILFIISTVLTLIGSSFLLSHNALIFIDLPIHNVSIYWINVIIIGMMTVSPIVIFINKLNSLFYFSHQESKPETTMASPENSDFNSLIDIVPLPIMVFNDNDEIVCLNKAFVTQFGFESSDIRSVEEFFENGFPEIEARQTSLIIWRKDVQDLKKNLDFSNENIYVIKRKDGQALESSIRFKSIGQTLIAIFSIEPAPTPNADTLKERGDNIKLNYNEFLKLNEELLQSNDEITEMNQRLMIAKTKAEESDYNKTLFLRNMSHQMRTPLNAIIGFTEMLKFSDFEDTQRESYVDIVLNSGYQLVDVVNDIVYASTIESNIVNLYEEPCNINDMINSIVLSHQEKAKDKNLKITANLFLDTADSMVILDGKKVQEIISKLLHNAIKFTSKGSISLGYSIRNDFIVFSVKDTGIGIKQEYHQTVFERFSKVTTAMNHKSEGIGLGLFISKSLVELMGGKIWLLSEDGKGVTFFFTVPYKACHKAEENHPQ